MCFLKLKEMTLNTNAYNSFLEKKSEILDRLKLIPILSEIRRHPVIELLRPKALPKVLNSWDHCTFSNICILIHEWLQLKNSKSSKNGHVVVVQSVLVNAIVEEVDITWDLFT